MRLKKYAAGIISITLAFGMLFPASFGSRDSAEAAEAVKGLQGHFAFYTDDDKNTSDEIATWGGEKAIQIESLNNITLSCSVYIPISAYEANEDAGIGYAPILSLGKSTEEGKTFYEAQIKKVDSELRDGEVDHWYYDESKSESDPEYGNAEIVGDFVKLSINDGTVDTNKKVAYRTMNISTGESTEGEMSVSDFTSGEFVAAVIVGLDSWARQTDRSGNFLVTDLVIKNNGEEVFAADYDTTAAIGEIRADDGGTDLSPVALNTVFSLSSEKVKMKKGAASKVTVKPHFEKDAVTVTSSNKKIATASYKNGKITIKGVKQGSATITVKSGNITKKIKVTVNNPEFKVSKTSVTVKVKKTVKVSVTTIGAKDTVKVTPKNKKIATASYKNGKITITGKKKGSTVITVKPSQGKKKTIKVKVTK